MRSGMVGAVACRGGGRAVADETGDVKTRKTTKMKRTSNVVSTYSRWG